MSNRAPGRDAATTTEEDTTSPVRPGKPPGNRRRQARDARLAAAKAAARRAKRRRQAILSAIVAVVVAGVIVGLALWLTNRKPENNTASTAGSAAASTSPAPLAGPTVAPSFPQLPPGADPALAKKPVVTKGTGNVTALKVTTLIKGKGAEVKSGQTITVNYVGVTYKDGKEFDSSWSRSQTFPTPIGQGKVIPGWDQGLVGVTVGSRVQLDIPANLAYGETTDGSTPAGALRFVVDVLAAS